MEAVLQIKKRKKKPKTNQSASWYWSSSFTWKYDQVPGINPQSGHGSCFMPPSLGQLIAVLSPTHTCF